MIPGRGSLLLVNLEPTRGHEQRGVRPAVVVSDPLVIEDQRFPLIGVVPVTGTRGEGALYPELAPGDSGLKKTSYALTDQVRSIDKRRVLKRYGNLRPEEIDAIDEGLRLFFAL